MHFAATHDEVTGIWNRAQILNFLAREINRARREHKSVGIALIDIDLFKHVNDNLGHAAADSVLQAVAKNLLSGLRTYDGAGRYGGEEFLLVIPGCSLTVLQQRCEQLRESVATLSIATDRGPAKITVSIGIIEAGSQCQLGAQELIQRADAALYQAKQKGRNRVECARNSTLASSPLVRN